MLGRRARLPVLAEISGSEQEPGRAWSLRRADHERLRGVLPVLAERPVVLVSGEEETGPTVALACAAASAAAGRRTVLVECDLERPRLAAELGLAEVPGLHEYLRWEATPPEILQPAVLAGPAAAGPEPLVCVTAGRAAADPLTLFGLQSFAHMTEKLRSAYEQVVLAGPPARSAPEQLQAIALRCDAVLAAMPAEAASGRGGRAIRSSLRALSAPAVGVVAVAS